MAKPYSVRSMVIPAGIEIGEPSVLTGRLLPAEAMTRLCAYGRLNSGQCLNILHGHTNSVRSVAFSPDGKTLASGGYDQTVRLWEVSSGKLLNTLRGHSHVDHTR